MQFFFHILLLLICNLGYYIVFYILNVIFSRFSNEDAISFFYLFILEILKKGYSTFYNEWVLCFTEKMDLFHINGLPILLYKFSWAFLIERKNLCGLVHKQFSWTSLNINTIVNSIDAMCTSILVKLYFTCQAI